MYLESKVKGRWRSHNIYNGRSFGMVAANGLNTKLPNQNQ